MALSGRVPVKVNNEGGVIAIGDRITLSSVSGVGTKATTTAETIGIALEAFNGTTGTVEVFVERRNNFLTSQFYVDSNGNVGIGTTSPAYKLHVLGDVAATSFINISTRDAKKDISHLTPSQETDFLAKIKTTNIAKYHYNIEDQNNPLRLGLIAEEAPAEILSVDGKGVDVYKMATFTLGGVKALQKEIEKMKIDLVSLQASAGASASSADKSSGTGSDGLFAWILNKFMTTLGIGFEQGKICLEDVCVNKTQLKELLEKNNISQTSSSSSSSAVASSSSLSSEASSESSASSSSSSSAEVSSSSSAESSSSSEAISSGSSLSSYSSSSSSVSSAESSSSAVSSSSSSETASSASSSSESSSSTSSQPESSSSSVSS